MSLTSSQIKTLDNPAQFIIDFVEKNVGASVIMTPTPKEKNEYLYNPDPEDGIHGFFLVMRYPFMTYTFRMLYEGDQWEIALKHTGQAETINKIATLIASIDYED